MARGIRRSMEERIAEIDGKIKKKQDEISALKEQRKELSDSKKNELAVKIAEIAQEKGFSLDEILALVAEK